MLKNKTSYFIDHDNGQIVRLDKKGREDWYYDWRISRTAYRKFDRKGNVIYYKNSDGEETIRKFDKKNNLIYSNDCGRILVDKRKTRPIREKLNKIKWKYKYREPLKFKIKYLIFRIKYRKEIKEVLKKVGE